ncbi:uncharacterized protein LOC121382114 isoform X2 [Gigantopelta aegis]|uniref:uncharacterized protein LOC121382114 isoform X2 n=1 Tax=Gigantopelta aegis TaxID=1735272 RepID=UPI001B888339|nr:uncharacterized protein LOC121382114 isoform X2 [Gigantopelta aegis]
MAPTLEDTEVAQNVNSSSLLENMRAVSRQKTTYTSMNEWRDNPMARAAVCGTAPASGPRWHQDRVADAAKPLGQRSVDEFNKAYCNLTKQIAYIHPNPGPPRCREGRIGGTWRHIKEVLGHSGSRVVFVDGLVSIYDSENFNNALHDEGPYRPHLASARYAPCIGDLQSYNRRELSELQTCGYRPSMPQDPRESGHLPKVITPRYPETQLQSPIRYKGFYKSK